MTIDCLLKVGTPDFVELLDPIEWLREIRCQMRKDEPSRQKYAMKFHAHFRNFLIAQLNGSLMTDAEACVMRDQAVKLIEGITKPDMRKANFLSIMTEVVKKLDVCSSQL